MVPLHFHFATAVLAFGLLSPLFIGDEWVTQMETLIQNKEIATAENLIVKKLVATPRDPALITLLAEVRFNQGRYEEALRLLDDAAAIAGPSAKGETLRGLVDVLQNRPDLAEPMFRKAIGLDPKFAFAHYYLSRLLYSQNHFNEAIQESHAAIAAEPNLVRAYENLGHCYEAEQRIAEAERWYGEAIRREKKGGRQTEWPSLDMATMLIRNDRIEEAKPHLLDALRLNPQNPESHFQMAILLEKSGDLQGALQELQKTLSLDPKKAEVHYRAARILQRLGKNKEALQEFDQFKKASESQHKPD